jgi:hypothetical protein
MRALSSRLGRIEQRVIAGRGRCKECDGRGAHSMAVEIDGVLVRPPTPCRGCGQLACVRTVVLRDWGPVPVGGHLDPC